MNITIQIFLKLLLRLQSGSIKKAVSLKDREEEYTKTNQIFNNLENIDIIDIMESKEQIFKDKTQIDDILSYINLIFSDKIKENIKYVECMKKVEDTKDRLNKNNNFDMTIDNFIMTVWEEING